MTINTKQFLDKLFSTFKDYQRKKLEKSWCLQNREERKARREAVIELSVELARIRSVSIFSTAFGEALIESIIEGDWEYALEYAKDLRFTHERDDIRATYAPLWATFVALAESFCAKTKARNSGVLAKPS